MKTTLFVYGTLKRGERNHRLLAGQEFLGEAATMPLYRLYDLGPFPGLVLDMDDGREIHGELWAVDEAALAALDDFEGVPDLFIRADVAVRHQFDTVQAYLYNGAIEPGTPEGDRWPLPT